MVAKIPQALSLLLLWANLAGCSRGGPLVFDRSGTHVLSHDVVGSGDVAVHVTADNVVLDLNGHTIRCAPSQPATAATFGVVAEHRASITVRNGAITGCKFGISGAYGRTIVLDGVNFAGNTYVGANLGFGNGNIVRRCRFATIGGYTTEAYAVGVNGIGVGGLVENNTFEDIYRQPNAEGVGEGVGVLVEETATNVVVRNNKFTNAQPREHTIGVWSASGAVTAMTANTLVNFAYGVQGSGLTVTANSFLLTASVPGNAAIVADSAAASGNTISGYDAAIRGRIVDGGGNVIATSR